MDIRLLIKYWRSGFLVSGSLFAGFFDRLNKIIKSAFVEIKNSSRLTRVKERNASPRFPKANCSLRLAKLKSNLHSFQSNTLPKFFHVHPNSYPSIIKRFRKQIRKSITIERAEAKTSALKVPATSP